MSGASQLQHELDEAVDFSDKDNSSYPEKGSVWYVYVMKLHKADQCLTFILDLFSLRHFSITDELEYWDGDADLDADFPHPSPSASHESDISSKVNSSSPKPSIVQL